MRGTDLSDIDMLDSTSGWAVGQTKAYSYDGVSWNEQSSGLGSSLTLRSISAVANNDVWAVGSRTVNTSTTSTLARWDGATWSPVGPVFTSTVSLFDLKMTNSNDGWAVGGDFLSPNEPLLLHYDGTNWSRVPGPPSDARYFLYVSIDNSGGVWATGPNSSFVGQIYRYSGGVWTTWVTPDSSFSRSIFMINPSAGWVATNNSVLQWDGTAWTVEYTERNLNGVGGVNGQTWAVGNADTVLSRPSSGTWTLQRGGPTTNMLNSVSALNANEAWAVGEKGTFLHYTSGTWALAPVSQSITTTIYDVQAVSPNEAYAVGYGLIAQWDGNVWAPVVTRPNGYVFSLAILSSGEGWAVGSGIWHLSGGSWTQIPGAPVGLRAVAMDSPSHGWAIGGTETPILYEYTNSAWVNRTNLLPPNTPYYMDDMVLAPGGNEGWAVGYVNRSNPDERSILHLSNGVWTLDPGVRDNLSTVALENPNTPWTGSTSVMYKYDNGAWVLQDYGSRRGSRGITFVQGQLGWSVGYEGRILRYDPPPAGTPTPTVTGTPPTATPTGTSTTVPTATSTPIPFIDVPPDNPFYQYIECLAGRGIIGGYADGTFRPGNNITRGQIAKMVSNAAGIEDDPGPQVFEDVPSDSPFYLWINRLSNRGYMGGYPCGGEGEPCNPPDNRPYFRPGSNATRGQLAKIVSNTAGIVGDPTDQFYADVPTTHPFYLWIMRLTNLGVMSGYDCGRPEEPCDDQNRPYFRPFANVTRGQASKIVANTFFPNCQTP